MERFWTLSSLAFCGKFWTPKYFGNPPEQAHKHTLIVILIVPRAIANIWQIAMTHDNMTFAEII